MDQYSENQNTVSNFGQNPEITSSIPKKSFLKSAISTQKRSIVTFGVLGVFLILTLMATSAAYQIANTRNGIASNPKANEIGQMNEYEQLAAQIQNEQAVQDRANSQNGDANNQNGDGAISLQAGDIQPANACYGTGVATSDTLNGRKTICSITCNGETQVRAQEYKYGGWIDNSCGDRATQYCCANAPAPSEVVPTPSPTLVPTNMPESTACGEGTLGPRDRIDGSSKCSITCKNGNTRVRYAPNGGSWTQESCSALVEKACCVPTPRS